MTGPRADWPASAAHEDDLHLREQVILHERDRRLATVGAMSWYVVVDHWWPERGTANVTVYEYPTAEPAEVGQPVWGCQLDGVRKADQVIPAAAERLTRSQYWRLTGEWQREGDRWLAPVQLANR